MGVLLQKYYYFIYGLTDIFIKKNPIFFFNFVNEEIPPIPKVACGTPRENCPLSFWRGYHEKKVEIIKVQVRDPSGIVHL